MRILRRLCALAAVALLPAVAAAETRVGGQMTLQQLTRASDTVVLKTCTDKQVRVVGRHVETDYTVKVTEPLKGKRTAGQVINMTYPGGELTTPPITQAVQGMPHMLRGEDVALFLDEKPVRLPASIEARRDSKSRVTVGPRIVGLDEGKFTVFTDKATGQRRVTRISLENYGYAHQDKVFQTVLRAVATNQMNTTSGTVVALGGGVYTSPQGKALLDRIRLPEPPKNVARSAGEVRSTIGKREAPIVQDLESFKAQIKTFAN